MNNTVKLLLIISVILLAYSCSAEAREVKHQYERNVFQQKNPCPTTGRTSGPCPGFVITNLIPFKCGGKDTTFNMMWMMETQSKERDRKPCAEFVK